MGPCNRSFPYSCCILHGENEGDRNAIECLYCDMVRGMVVPHRAIIIIRSSSISIGVVTNNTTYPVEQETKGTHRDTHSDH
mmetsp:Transcript_25837/g.28905  ORF Transcript_25837/g.28905 Transcript_25837/m.28905 type:complete len:81 (-) Transcript_25837:43-285(-)